jgi:flagellar basal body L-ring protein FlgH
MKRFAVVLILGLMPIVVSAQSLWKEGSLYTASKYKQGDLIKIVFKRKNIVEFSTFQQNQESASLNNPDKSATMVLNFLPQLSGDNMNKSSKSASVKNRENVNFSIMTAVQSIESNGNLRIAGQHQILINNQRETVRLQGIVNPARIVGDRVLSEDVYDLSMEYDRQVFKKDLVTDADLKDATSVTNMELLDPKKRELILKYFNQVLPLLFQ